MVRVRKENGFGRTLFSGMTIAVLALITVTVSVSMAQEKQETKLPLLPGSKLSVETMFFDGGQYLQSTTNEVKVDRPADQVWKVLTDNGMANWHKYFPGGAGFKRIKGGPQPEIRVGDVLSETLTKEGPPREYHYTVTGVSPGRLLAIEGHVVLKGVVNPKGRWVAVWTFFPEPDGGTRVVRYFCALSAAKPTYTLIASDPELMQKMLEKFKTVVEAELPKK